MIYYFDIDGVLRDLAGHVLEDEIIQWDQRNEEGKTVLQIVNEDPSIILEAEPFHDYIEIANQQPKLHILSAQPKSWRKYTIEWLCKHFKNGSIIDVIFVNSPMEKLAYLGDNILIDDYPLFQSYEKVWLVSRKYNEHLINVPVRINKADELRRILMED